MLHLQKCQKEAFDSFKKLRGSFQSEALNKTDTILQNVLAYICICCRKKNQLKNFTQLHKRANIKS